MREVIASAAAVLIMASSALAAPIPTSIVADVDSGSRAALMGRGFGADALISADMFAPPHGVSVDLDASEFPADSSVSGDHRVESLSVVSGASHVTFTSEDRTMAMRLQTRLPMDAMPPEFQQYVEPAWDCESQARYLDAHGYALIFTHEDGAAERDRILIGDESLGAAMTWSEARATGVVARHFNGYIQIDMIVSNEHPKAPYTIDTGLREYSGIAVTGEAIVVPDGVADDKIDSRLWTVVVKKPEPSSSSGGCAAGAAGIGALALAALCRRRDD